jgi:uncharacterized spore protein YtfJ
MGTQELLSRLAENVSVRRAFGAAYEKDGLLIIPVALVAGGGGGGDRTYPPPGAAASGTAASGTGGADVAGHHAGQPVDGLPAGSGSGGGFGGLIMPVGVYVVNGDQVRWVPAVDVTVLVLASLGAVRLLVGLGSRARRRRLS